MLRLFRGDALLPQDLAAAAKAVRDAAGHDVNVRGEICFVAETSRALNEREREVVDWLLAETFEPELYGEVTHLDGMRTVIEIGPRLNFETAWASTALSILRINGIDAVQRIERFRRYGFDEVLDAGARATVAAALHDRMVETVYDAPPSSFDTGATRQDVEVVPLLREGIAALHSANRTHGLAMDEADIERFYELFVSTLQRDPTMVELFQLAQGNSEHCRHGFFKGRLRTADGELPESLMSIVKEPWRANPNNSVIAFHDDSSAIRGARVTDLLPAAPGEPSRMERDEREYHLTLTAETHNHPCAVAPYPGAATGTGGRIRDNQAVGRGGIVQVSGAGYCVGNLHLDDAHRWENDGQEKPASLAAPLDILVQASNGASDYGNCFGEPLIHGFVRTFGMQTPGGYRAWFKPVMYSAGAGQIDARHTEKGEPEAGLLLVQIGGPAYRIGMGGGAASSLMAGENAAALDFDSVQRGDPEMEQRMHRVMRACVEMGDENPIVSAHDLGAGGDCNALPEIAYPAGARIELRSLPVGDRSLSVLEIWGNESQERNVVLVRPESVERLRAIADRERAPLAVVGEITGDGRLLVHDSADDSTPVDLPLEPVLGDVPPKEIVLADAPAVSHGPLHLEGVTVPEALDRLLRLPAIASKSFLTRKVDRCVSGRVAQQQCVGPNHLPLSDFAVTAQSLFASSGTALAFGEQPLKGIIDPAAMARMAVAEAVLNMSGARITRLADIRCSANWMWPAKLPGEGAALHAAAVAMRDIMLELGMAVDGGKDSLSMAVAGSGGAPVKAPGQLVIAAYAPMPDVRVKVTPDLKRIGDALILIGVSGGAARLGGSALAQVYQQTGDTTPDIDDGALLARAFAAIQDLVAQSRILAAHDVSDGGPLVAAVEMAFAGNAGVDLDMDGHEDPLAACFAEEAGVVVETADAAAVLAFLAEREIPARLLGRVMTPDHVTVRHRGVALLESSMPALRAVWDDTGTQIDRLQANPACVDEEARVMRDIVTPPQWRLSFTPEPAVRRDESRDPFRVAVIRDQGSNGDRELAAAFVDAGFDVWDVTMSDILDARITLESFRGVAFPGGFSYGDVLDAGKAWAGIVRFHPHVAAEFERFRTRPDTFSLGVCNGAQLMALMGWVPGTGMSGAEQPRFVRNTSGRFECRFVTVEITESPSIMLAGMAGSRMGVWVAHGEGRLRVAPGAQLDAALTPMRYVDPSGEATETYPFNPNGSPGGITGLTSPDGRHLAIMPHPERVAGPMWQWPWLPEEWRGFTTSPWLRMFQNARSWCASRESETSTAAV